MGKRPRPVVFWALLKGSVLASRMSLLQAPALVLGLAQIWQSVNAHQRNKKPKEKKVLSWQKYDNTMEGPGDGKEYILKPTHFLESAAVSTFL